MKTKSIAKLKIIKLILNLLIVVIKILVCASERTAYDWQVRTIERDSDFGDDLKMQTALNNERQQDLLKMSGKTNIEYYPNSFETQFNKNTVKKLGKTADVNEKNRNLFTNEMDKKYKSNAELKKLVYQNNKSKEVYKSNYDNAIDYDDYNADYRNSYITDKTDYGEIVKSVPLGDENEYRQHDLIEKFQHSSTGQHGSNEAKSRSINNTLKEDTKNKYEDKQIFNNYKKNSSESEEFAFVYNHSGKYLDLDSFVGTNLFDAKGKKCFSTDDVALLATRKSFESLIPKKLPQCLVDDHMVALLLNYFYICHQMIMRTTTADSRHLSQKAFYDTLGGYLNFYMVPVTKYSYYAGQISLNTAQQVLALHQESKKFLNTNGNGWKAPLKNVLIELKSVHIEPLHIPDLNVNERNEPSFCMQLCMDSDDNQPDDDKMIVRIPKLETENARGFLGNIWLPFKRKKTFDLKSESSSYIVVKFYETVTKCYRFENVDQEFYNKQFERWLQENVNVHLSDDEFYPGLGAVLRIYEYLKQRTKLFIEIGDDLGELEDDVGMINKNHRNHDTKYNIKRTKHNETNDKHRELKKSIDYFSKESDRNGTADQQTEENEMKVNKIEAAVNETLLSTLNITLRQIVIIAILVVAIIFIAVFCTCTCFSKKKKSEAEVIPKKNSSSSSSNLINSPVRFFHIRKKSASGSTNKDSSSKEAGNKKHKRAVKIEKTPLLNSDSSVSISPVRKKKSQESSRSKKKGKSMDSGKSNV